MLNGFRWGIFFVALFVMAPTVEASGRRKGYHDQDPSGQSKDSPAAKKVEPGRANAPATDQNWVVVECLSNGTCVYEHKITKERRTRDSKKGLGNATPTVLPFEDLQKSFSDEVPSDSELSEKEAAFVKMTGVQSLAELKEKIRLSKKMGRDFLILQVGNLEGCPPCQAIDSAIKASSIAKDGKVGVYDTNYLALKDAGLSETFKSMKLPDGFPFPHIFVLRLSPDKDWISHYQGFSRDQAGVKALTESIEGMRKLETNPKKE